MDLWIAAYEKFCLALTKFLLNLENLENRPFLQKLREDLE